MPGREYDPPGKGKRACSPTSQQASKKFCQITDPSNVRETTAFPHLNKVGCPSKDLPDPCLGGFGRRIARRPSPLENLPTELLECVFFHCLNVCLPQASLIIGRKLASDHVKNRLVVSVLSSTHGYPYPSALAAIFPALEDQAKAQSAILELRWMTFPFLQKLIPEYVVQTMVRELGVSDVEWLAENESVVLPTREPILRQYIEKKCQENPSAYLELERRDTDHVFDSEYVEGLRMIINLQDGQVALESYRWHPPPCRKAPCSSTNKWRIVCAIDGCRIPSKLLHGPWTQEKCDFLELLLRSKASVDWVNTTSGEIASEGLTEAIEEGNARAIAALVSGDYVDISYKAPPNCSTLYPGWERVAPRRSADGFDFTPVPYPCDTRGVGVVPTQEHFRKAVIKHLERREQGKDVLATLLLARDLEAVYEAVDPLDPLIERLFVDADRRGDERALSDLRALQQFIDGYGGTWDERLAKST